MKPWREMCDSVRIMITVIVGVVCVFGFAQLDNYERLVRARHDYAYLCEIEKYWKSQPKQCGRWKVVGCERYTYNTFYVLDRIGSADRIILDEDNLEECPYLVISDRVAIQKVHFRSIPELVDYYNSNDTCSDNNRWLPVTVERVYDPKEDDGR